MYILLNIDWSPNVGISIKGLFLSSKQKTFVVHWNTPHRFLKCVHLYWTSAMKSDKPGSFNLTKINK